MKYNKAPKPHNTIIKTIDRNESRILSIYSLSSSSINFFMFLFFKNVITNKIPRDSATVMGLSPNIGTRNQSHNLENIKLSSQIAATKNTLYIKLIISIDLIGSFFSFWPLRPLVPPPGPVSLCTGTIRRGKGCPAVCSCGRTTLTFISWSLHTL